ncbi:hypothetical protein [Paracoccus sp. (in: a-proteobacteria)]|uniref:hypothetical protein n=1 Tax=Paracoccus sp. TaxID=267 RepID=UPI00396CC538
MSLTRILLATSLALAATPAAATCADRISYLEEVLDEAARMSISTSSGGQGVAGSREGQAMSEVDSPEPAAPYQEEPEEAEAIEEAEEAGEGGDRILQARAALGEARATEESGDAEACEGEVREILINLILN